MSDSTPLNAATEMSKVLTDYPAAKQALFAHFHIGGCQSCAYGDKETLSSVCERNELALNEVIDVIQTSHEHNKQYLISPGALAKMIHEDTENLIILDTRTREEHEAVRIPHSVLLTQDLQQTLFASPPDKKIIFYDHTGDRVFDTCSWFAGHGITQCLALHGGIDAYSKEVDSSLPRYRLEVEM